jgi:carboxypeptidase T
MKKILFSAIFALLFLDSFSQDIYSRIKVFANHEELQVLASQGVAIDQGVFKAGVYVICELSSAEIELIRQSGIEYEVLIPDVSAFYRERNAPYLSQLDELKQMEYALSREWPVPEGFELGTCGGFLTIDQAMEHLDNMATLYPELVSPRATLDYETHNGRNIYWVRLSDNPNTNEDEPEVLYTGMHHAREAIGLQLLVYYMYYLLENYETNPEVQYIVNNFELYFIPIINADGYAYNIQNNPGGGGMWRKNRRQNSDGSYGVDPNRNYSYMWGYNNSGSSPVPSDDTYRGPSAFSEPETMALRDFCNEHEFRIALNYHSYSNLLLYPWGWTEDPCEHDAIFHAFSEIMTTENGYTYGAGSTTIYPTNGGSDDWMYGEQETKELIYSWTPEVGDGNAGFWPPVSQIIPLCQENMYQNIMAALLAGPYAVVRDLGSSIIETKTGLFFFELKRLGLEDGATFTVSIEPLSDAIASISAPQEFSDLELLETASAAFTYTLRDDIVSGDIVEYLLQVDNGLAVFSDTISKIYGTPLVIFEDSASDFGNWNSNKWNITTAQSHSPLTSIADSPFGQYGNNENNIITLNGTIDLTDMVFASLGYWAKWDIESGYDYVQVFISDNNGATWNPVQGKYTHPGNSNQAFGEPLYDGMQNSWVKEEISLSDYLDKEIKIRFKLVSDVYVVGDGFFWDDMTVTVIDLATGIDDNDDDGYEDLQKIASLHPNPASGNISVNYTLDKPELLNSVFKIFDLSGKMVYETKLINQTGKINLDVSNWSPGMYFYAISFNSAILESSRFIVR